MTDCTSHKLILCAICVPKIIEVGGHLTNFWQKSAQFFETVYTLQFRIEMVLAAATAAAAATITLWRNLHDTRLSLLIVT